MLTVLMTDEDSLTERIVALNLDVPWSTKRRLRGVVRELEDLAKKASMTSVLVHLVQTADARAMAGQFPDAVVRRRRRETTTRAEPLSTWVAGDRSKKKRRRLKELSRSKTTSPLAGAALRAGIPRKPQP